MAAITICISISKLECDKYHNWKVQSTEGHRIRKNLMFQKARKRLCEEVGWSSEINWLLNTEKKFVCVGKFSSVHLVTQSNTLWPHGVLHARPPCPSPTPGVYSNSYPLGHDAIQPCLPLSSPFTSTLQSFPASGSFPKSKFFIFIKVEISAWEFQVECLIQVLGPNKRQKLTLWSSVFKQKIFWIKNPDE